MNTNACWKPGDSVVLRGVWRRKLWWAGLATVVQDDVSLIALYWPAGTPNKIPEKHLTPKDLLSTDQVALVDRKWVNTEVLMLGTHGVAHAVYAMWEQGHKSFRCWYIDLQEPLRRTSMGFDTMDHLLDIVVSPDRSEWRWRDEDELNEAVEIGVFSTEEADAIRAEGERVLELMQAGASPIYDGWERWSQATDWEIPAFPVSWDTIDDDYVHAVHDSGDA